MNIAQLWFLPILPHKLSSNLEGSGGHLLWTLIFSSFQRFSIGFKSADWLGHSNSLIFFLWNQLRVSLAICLGSLSCWNVHPRFIFSILVDGSRFLSRMSRYISPFILPSIIWSLPVPDAEKQPHTTMVPPPNFTAGMVFLGWLNLFIGHQWGLIQLILICTNRGQDCFLNTDRFQLVYWLPMPFYTPFSSCVQYLFPLSFHFITHNFCHGHAYLDFLKISFQ